MKARNSLLRCKECTRSWVGPGCHKSVIGDHAYSARSNLLRGASTCGRKSRASPAPTCALVGSAPLVRKRCVSATSLKSPDEVQSLSVKTRSPSSFDCFLGQTKRPGAAAERWRGPGTKSELNSSTRRSPRGSSNAGTRMRDPVIIGIWIFSILLCVILFSIWYGFG